MSRGADAKAQVHSMSYLSTCVGTSDSELLDMQGTEQQQHERLV